MATLRTSLGLILVLLVGSLTCDLAAWAPVAADCQGPCRDAGADPEVPSGSLSGNLAAGIPERAQPASSPRLAVAIPGGATAERPFQVPPLPSDPFPGSGPAAGSPPLYRTHCALLC